MIAPGHHPEDLGLRPEAAPGHRHAGAHGLAPPINGPSGASGHNGDMSRRARLRWGVRQKLARAIAEAAGGSILNSLSAVTRCATRASNFNQPN